MSVYMEIDVDRMRVNWRWRLHLELWFFLNPDLDDSIPGGLLADERIVSVGSGHH